MYDIVFLSYQEVNADKHWGALTKRFPRAMRVDNVEGIVTAHQRAAMLCRTKYFWVVDGDNVIHETFDFKHQWDRRDTTTDRVAVWRAVNNVNNLVYGYGGVKLLPRRAVLDVAPTVTDFTTSISEHFHPMEDIASTTIINSTPFDAWKAGFRECTKLSSNIIKRGNASVNEDRLRTWTTLTNDVVNAEYCVMGAIQGQEFGSTHATDPLKLALINDWGWLYDQFSTLLANKSV